jgi:hypothetical protein
MFPVRPSQALAAMVVVGLTLSAQARDSKEMYSIAAALASPDAQQALSDDIPLYFGTQAHPPVAQKFGNFASNKKSNGVGRGDETVCQRAFLSAMLSFQERARAEGGNAVVNLTSYYKKNHISSETEYECGSGAIMSGVTFRGDVVKLQ